LYDDVTVLGDIIVSIQRGREALLVPSKEIGLDVNAEKTEYVYVSRTECRAIT